MEKEAMTMMMIDHNQIPRNEASCKEPISWKLYENPFYYSQQPQQHHQTQTQIDKSKNQNQNHLRRLQLPLSARKIAASFWDLTFFRPIMESELDLARTQISELKSELERERRARKKADSASKRLAKDIAEERKRREAIQRICEELAGEITAGKAEIERRRREMEEERKMMRVAEILREERVQMKLADAKNLLEEKISELEAYKLKKTESSLSSSSSAEQINQEDDSSTPMNRAINVKTENPHIRRGIRGFVEFPRVVRAIGSKSRHWGSKLECQRAQLRILLKQRSSVGSSEGLIAA